MSLAGVCLLRVLVVILAVHVLIITEAAVPYNEPVPNFKTYTTSRLQWQVTCPDLSFRSIGGGRFLIEGLKERQQCLKQQYESSAETTTRPAVQILMRQRPPRSGPNGGMPNVFTRRKSRLVRKPTSPMAVRAVSTGLELPLTSNAFRCVPKPERLSFCSGIAYDKLRLPNRYQQDNVDEIVRELEEWRPLVASRVCHESVFVCLSH